MESIRVDGVAYRVRVVFGSLEQSFSIVEGPNAGTSIKKRQIRDILGTSYGYTIKVERNPEFPDDFDDFYDTISAPVDSHTVEMPYGQDALSFEAAIYTGKMIYSGIRAGRKYWTGLEVSFSPIEPQRTE